jgi:putative serine protease PepD
VDDPFAGDDRQHKSWRDLPPTPPLVWPTAPPFATATAAAGASPMPLAGAPRRPRRRLMVGTVALIGVIVLVGTGALATGGNLGALLAPLATAGGPGSSDKGAAAPPLGTDEPLADMAARLLPSVVQIEAGGAMGSGFVAADGGLILTASHVVGTSDVVTLTLHDGTSISGAVVAVDKSIDTAVIRAEESAGTDLQPLDLGALADVQVGEMTIAIGSPFGLSQTVTTGIVSALGRTVPTPMGELHDLIQTDAAINSGNSGGPLINGEGRAIGINTAIASASGGSDGIGFAVPVDQAAQILGKVKDGTWRPEDNNPADSMDPLGGLFDRFLGPDGLDGLEDLFGLGPDGSQSPDGPSGGSEMADQLLRQLLDELLNELLNELDAAVPQPAPDPDPAPAPEDADDPTAEAFDDLMNQLLDELFQELSPNGMPDPFAPDGDPEGQGI